MREVGIFLVCVLALILFLKWDSEQSKRIELEGRCDFQESIIDSAITLTMTTRHTMSDCYFYQSEMSFLIAIYYQGETKIGELTAPDSRLAAPPIMALLWSAGK